MRRPLSRTEIDLAKCSESEKEDYAVGVSRFWIHASCRPDDPLYARWVGWFW